MKFSSITSSLKSNVGSNPTMFFAGAGMSRPSGIPVFGELYGTILRHLLGKNATRSETQAFIRDMRPETIAEAVSSIFGSQLFDFYSYFLDAKPNANHQFLAQALNSGSCVFTTNVDTLIEDCCDELGIGYELCVEEDEFIEFNRRRIQGASVNASGCIFKLRGSLSRGENLFRSIPLTIEDETKGLSEAKVEAIQTCLKNLDVVVLGYSGMDHFSVQPVLSDTASDQKMFWHSYAEGAKPKLEKRDVFEAEMEIAREDIIDGQLDNPEEWAKISMNEILLERKESFRIVADTSELLKQVLLKSGRKPIQRNLKSLKVSTPSWTKRVPNWKRQLLKARLQRFKGDYVNAETSAKKSLKAAKGDLDKAKACGELGNIFISDSIAATNGFAADNFGLAADYFRKGKDFENQLSSQIEQANVYRRMRDFDESGKRLRRTLKQIEKSKMPVRSKQKLTSFAKGTLALGRMPLGENEASSDQKTLSLAEEAINLAFESGNLRRWSSSLNNDGLLRFLIAKSHDELEVDCERLLSGYRINRRLLNNRGCYQQMRNLGLVQQKLARLSRKKDDKSNWLESALDSFTQAAEHVARITPGARGESLEANFRIGETLCFLGRKEEAMRILTLVADERREIEGQWHNEGRCHELSIQCASKSKAKLGIAHRIFEIYSVAWQSEKGRVKLLGKTDPIVRKNVLGILSAAILTMKNEASSAAKKTTEQLKRLLKEIKDGNQEG